MLGRVAALGSRTNVRAAAHTLLNAYKASLDDGKLRQVYQARPASINPPCAFIDSISEGSIGYTPAGMQRTPDVAIRFVRGTFDRADVAEANDELVDGFIDYVVANKHAAGANTISTISSAEDEDGWVPEWMPADRQAAYYTTVVAFSAEGLFGGLT